MSGLTDWLDSNARRVGAPPEDPDLLEWEPPDTVEVVVLQEEIEEQALLAQFDAGTEASR